MGMRGRLLWQGLLLVIEGVLIFIFANTGSLAGAIVVMVFFSTIVQSAEGSTYGIVPYVNPPVTGSIAGVVGAGGNCGAVGFGLGFRQLEPKDAFYVMASIVCASGILTFFICIKGHASLVCGKDSEEAIAAYTKSGAGAAPAQTLVVPEPDAEAATEEEADDKGEEKSDE